jgi:hypothetical protein
MNIFKLNYENEQQGLDDLKSKGIFVETEGIDGNVHLAYGEGVQAVVNIGKILLTPPVMEGMEVIEEPIYADGYHYDVMSDNTYDFGSNLVEPKNPKHAFAGHSVKEEFPYEPQFLTDEN